MASQLLPSCVFVVFCKRFIAALAFIVFVGWDPAFVAFLAFISFMALIAFDVFFSFIAFGEAETRLAETRLAAIEQK